MPTSRGRILALVAALLGWMFDGMEMGLFPLVARDALGELLHESKTSPRVDEWFSIVMAMFLIGAATGGVVFGWLGDKLGRVRAMTVSVLLYSLASGLSGFAQDAWQFAGLRFLGALGMGGEWALGVALVMEVWGGQHRAFLAGLIGAAGNLGYTLCGGVAMFLNHNSAIIHDTLLANVGFDATQFLVVNGHWRMLMLMGALPALLTFVIRIFVPESETWTAEKTSGRASAWRGIDLIGVLFGAACAIGVVYLWSLREYSLFNKLAGTVVGLLLVAAGYLYPARKYLERVGLPPADQARNIKRMLLAAGLSGVALLGTWSAVMWMYQWVGKLPGGSVPDARAITQIWSSLGAAAGCVIGAWACEKLNRRIVYATMCVLSIASITAFYQVNTAFDTRFLITAAWMSVVSASFYGWLPLYLPEIFPTAVRATGQGFGFNFGRILAAAGNLQMPALLAYFGNDYAKACALVPIVYVVGLVLIYFAPETKGKALPQ